MAETLAAGAPLILLYVEDDQVTRQAVCAMVGRRFPELAIHSAANGAEGLQRYLELKPDLVVTDIEMPVMHGIEMSRRIMALQRATPIIMTSAHNEMDYFIEAIEIGISRYVMKPIDKDKLFAAIEDALVTLRLERELKEQQAFIRKLSRVVEQSPSSIVITDPSGSIEYVNPRFADLTGYTGQEVLGQNLRALQQGGEELWRTLDAGLEWRGELEAVKKSGEPYSESTSISPVFNEHGAITHFVALQEDITERKRAAAEIVSLNEHLSARGGELEIAVRDLGDFRTLAENSPNIIIRYDRECRRVYVNHAYVLETGRSYDQAVGVFPEPSWTLNMPVEEYMSRLQQTIETGVAAEMLLEWIKPDGQRASHAFHVVAERDPAGKVTGCLAIGHNVTLLKEAEQRLAKLAENSPGAMYSFLLRPDGTSCMPYVSPRIEELTGLHPEELSIDMSEAYARIHPDDVARVQESIVESLRTLSPWRTEFRIRHPGKGEIWLEGHSMPEPKQNGASLWHGFLHEITERKRIDESLRAKREQLATMAVELSLAEERERRRIASELHDHVGQTLLLSRIKLGTLADVFVSGRDKITYDEIQSLLEQTIRDIRSLTQQLNPPLLASVGLEAALEWLAKRMEADYTLLVEFTDDRNEKKLTDELSSVVYQSARELLINVTKHSGTSRARLTISRDADMLVLAVEDQGSGFACLPNPGTNMPLDCSFGLFNIRQRIKLLGGSVMIDSTPGSGTRATIRVPVVVGR